MHSTTLTALLAALATTTTANTLTKRDTCRTSGVFPWFIAPHHDTRCSDTPPNFQPASGSPPGQTAVCRPMDPANHVGFASAGVNVPCSDYPFTVTLYNTINCVDGGVKTTVPGCFVAPNGGQFVAFSATPGH